MGEPTAEFASLKSRLFEYLARHPDGTPLAELERAFGLRTEQIAPVLQALIDDGKVERRGLLYFAI